MKTIHPGHLEHRFCIFGCQILCITDLAIMPHMDHLLVFLRDLNDVRGSLQEDLRHRGASSAVNIAGHLLCSSHFLLRQFQTNSEL